MADRQYHYTYSWQYPAGYPYPYRSTQVNGPLRYLQFSERELKELLIAVGALVLAFSIAFIGGIFGNITAMVLALPVALLGVGPGFVLHELGHKYMAQRYGLWAEFRVWKNGLFLALFTSLFGIVFAAPGAVYIAGYPTRAQNGKISAAGPLVNIVIALLFLPAAVLLRGSLIGYVSFYAGLINVFLGGFNLIPVWMLDGKKIFHWNKRYYFLLWAAIISIGLMLAYL